MFSGLYVAGVGSFDDAIRQHLDLKRRRGANPREVAQLELEALGPELEGDVEGDVTIEAASPALGSSAPTLHQDVVDWSDGHRLEARRSQLSQETMEIDMQAVIGTGRVELQGGTCHPRQAYDWSTDTESADISDLASNFEWETPHRLRLRGAA